MKELLIKEDKKNDKRVRYLRKPFIFHEEARTIGNILNSTAEKERNKE